MSRMKKLVRDLTDRRALCRQAVTQAGSVVTLMGPTSVVVQDISATGAKVCGWRLPPAGKQILLRIEGMQAFGAVAWSRFREAGVVFDTSAVSY